jgi:hypothetical protein
MALALRLCSSKEIEMRIVDSPVHDEAMSGTGEDRRQPPPTPESIVMAAMQQYESLLETAGLKLVGVTPTKSPVNVIEARQR